MRVRVFVCANIRVHGHVGVCVYNCMFLLHPRSSVGACVSDREKERKRDTALFSTYKFLLPKKMSKKKVSIKRGKQE